MALENLRIYIMALRSADMILTEAKHWDQQAITLIGDQLIRAVISVTNNISEGYARVSTGERVQLLMYAEGSTLEVRNAIGHAVKLGYLSAAVGEEVTAIMRQVSFGIIEFAWAIASRDPSYKSAQRTHLERRHQGILKSRLSKSQS